MIEKPTLRFIFMLAAPRFLDEESRNTDEKLIFTEVYKIVNIDKEAESAVDDSTANARVVKELD